MKAPTEKEPNKPHQHVNTDGYVLIVKCLNRDGTSHNGFIWPKSGPVDNPHWSRDATCSSGGLFGWPWGFGIGDGKNPNATHPWLVFRAKPENVIGEIEGDVKCKAVPATDGSLPEVVYYGDQGGAMRFTMNGRVACVEKNSSGSASATGWSGSASATGWRGIASASGEYSTIEIGKHSIGSSTSNRFTWKVIKGAVLLCQWTRDGKKFHTKTFDSLKMRLKEGASIKIQFGKVVKEFSND